MLLCLSILNIDDTFLTLEDFQIEKDITFEILTSYMFCFVFRELFSQHEKSDTLVSGLLDEVGTFYYKSLFSSLLMVHTCTVEFRYIEH